MLESQSLDGVAELDVDAQIIRVELELIVLAETGMFVDVQLEISNRRFYVETPMLVTRWRRSIVNYCFGVAFGYAG